MKDKLKKISDFEFELPKAGNMNVPGRIFMSEKLLKGVEDAAIQQLANVASLKGIQKSAFAMPDMHWGFSKLVNAIRTSDGFPIGGVAAFDLDEGIISPGGVGLK